MSQPSYADLLAALAALERSCTPDSTAQGEDGFPMGRRSPDEGPLRQARAVLRHVPATLLDMLLAAHAMEPVDAPPAKLFLFDDFPQLRAAEEAEPAISYVVTVPVTAIDDPAFSDVWASFVRALRERGGDYELPAEALARLRAERGADPAS